MGTLRFPALRELGGKITLDGGTATRSVFDWYGKPLITQGGQVEIDIPIVGGVSAGLYREGSDWNNLQWKAPFAIRDVGYSNGDIKYELTVSPILFKTSFELNLSEAYKRTSDWAQENVVQPLKSYVGNDENKKH